MNLTALVLKTSKTDDISLYYASIKFFKSVLKFASAMVRDFTSNAQVFT